MSTETILPALRKRSRKPATNRKEPGAVTMAQMVILVIPVQSAIQEALAIRLVLSAYI